MAKERVLTPIWVEGRGYWRLRVQKDGVRREFTVSERGRRGKKKVVERAEAWLDGTDVEQEQKQEQEEEEEEGEGEGEVRVPTVAETAAEWLDEVLETTGKTAWRQYNTYVKNYIIPAIGKLRVSELTNEQQIQKIINKAFRSGVRSGKKLSAKTLMNLRGTCSGFLKYARKAGLTTLRMENVTIPKMAVRGEKRTLQPEELRTLFTSDETTYRHRPVRDRLIHAYRFHVITGLRPGELIGLQWKDIQAGRCSIVRSINYYGEVTPGKNYNARRPFVLPQTAVEELKKQKADLERDGIRSDYVFPDKYGNPLKHKEYRRALLRYCEHNGIEDTCPYELRHTWYSINKALPTELVKQMGGHSASMDTFGVYGHEIEGEAQKFALMLDETLSEIIKPVLTNR